MAVNKPESEKHPDFVPLSDRPSVEIVNYSYQPSKAELSEDVRLKGTLERAAWAALVQPINLRRIRKSR